MNAVRPTPLGLFKKVLEPEAAGFARLHRMRLGKFCAVPSSGIRSCVQFGAKCSGAEQETA